MTTAPPRHREILDRLIEKGAELADQVHAQAMAAESASKDALVFERIARGVRRGIALARRMDAPIRNHAPARRQILRTVEDAIQRERDDDEADTLQAELLDRIDSPDLNEELDDRPAEAIITDILRDLGLAHIPGMNHPWARRTPAEITQLHARAARLALPPGPSHTAPDKRTPEPQNGQANPDHHPPPAGGDRGPRLARLRHHHQSG